MIVHILLRYFKPYYQPSISYIRTFVFSFLFFLLFVLLAMFAMCYAMTFCFDAAHCWRRFNRINLFDKSFIEIVTRCSIMWCVKAIYRLLHIPFDKKLLFSGCPFNRWLSAHTHSYVCIKHQMVLTISDWIQSWQLDRQWYRQVLFMNRKKTHTGTLRWQFANEICDNIININNKNCYE